MSQIDVRPVTLFERRYGFRTHMHGAGRFFAALRNESRSELLGPAPRRLVGETPIQFGQGLGEQRLDLWALTRGHHLSQERAAVPEVR
jgi:hypothetical protein